MLKNALDSAFYEWNRKPIAFVGYGGAGGVRAIEHLRGVAVELQMAPIKAEVNIAMEPFVGMLMHGKTPDDYDPLVKARETMFDQLAWVGPCAQGRAGKPGGSGGSPFMRAASAAPTGKDDSDRELTLLQASLASLPT